MSDNEPGGPEPSPVELREAVRRADQRSLLAAANAVNETTDAASRAAAQKAYIELRTALIIASRADPEEWSKSSSSKSDRSAIGIGLFILRAVMAVLLVAALFAITLTVVINGFKDGAPYISLLASLVGIALGWVFGATTSSRGNSSTGEPKADPRAGRKRDV